MLQETVRKYDMKVDGGHLLDPKNEINKMSMAYD